MCRSLTNTNGDACAHYVSEEYQHGADTCGVHATGAGFQAGANTLHVFCSSKQHLMTASMVHTCEYNQSDTRECQPYFQNQDAFQYADWKDDTEWLDWSSN
jgi:hypothetical protein